MSAQLVELLNRAYEMIGSPSDQSKRAYLSAGDAFLRSERALFQELLLIAEGLSEDERRRVLATLWRFNNVVEP